MAILSIFLRKNNMSLLFIFEIVGTIAFAISGAIVAIKNEMDIFGVVMLGLTTSVGGGILRDITLGNVPPTVFDNYIFLIVAIIVSLIVFIPKVREYIIKLDALVQIMDAIGLAIFTVVGVEASLSYNNLLLSLFCGTLTGVGGGVVRDIFARTKLYVFTKHFYACASLIGALLSFYLFRINDNLAIIIGFIMIFSLRMIAWKYKWNLPKAK